MRRRILTVALCVAVVLVLSVFLYQYITSSQMQNPFSSIEGKKIERIEADYSIERSFFTYLNLPPMETLSAEETDAVVRALQAVSIGKEMNWSQVPNGADFAYRIYTTNGSDIDLWGVSTSDTIDGIRIWTRVFSINGVPYETDDASLKTLTDIYNNCARLPQGPLTPYG